MGIKIKYNDIFIDRVPHSGAILLSIIYKGRRIVRTYYAGYSVREAIRMFVQELQGQVV